MEIRFVLFDKVFPVDADKTVTAYIFKNEKDLDDVIEQFKAVKKSLGKNHIGNVTYVNNPGGMKDEEFNEVGNQLLRG
jgi:hypothetical protein